MSTRADDFFSEIRTLVFVLGKGFFMLNNLVFSGIFENVHI